MKTRLNILSLLILAVFIFAVGYEIYIGGVDFRQGFRDGYNDRRIQNNETTATSPTSEKFGNPYFLRLLLNTEKDAPVDSIYNKKTGQYHTAEFTTVKIYSQADTSLSYMSFAILSTLILLFVFPTLVICFWSVILNINKEKIFDRSNIRSLRIMGVCFCLLAFCLGIPELILEIQAKEIIDIEGYSIVSGEWFMSSLWIYALISFLIAEVFAIGLRLKEEQDLTI